MMERRRLRKGGGVRTIAIVCIACLCACGLAEGATPARVRLKTPDDPVTEGIRKHMTAMGEYSLKPEHNRKNAEVYRFLYSPTFWHPVVVRLDVKPDGSGIITVKNHCGKGGYGPGRLRIIPGEINVSQEDVKVFRALLDEKAFWTMPEEESPVMSFLDGTAWLFEALQNGRYHAVHQSSSDVFGLLDDIRKDLRLISSHLEGSFDVYDVDSYLKEHGHEWEKESQTLGVNICEYLKNRGKLVVIADSLLDLTGNTILLWGAYEETWRSYFPFSKKGLAAGVTMRKEQKRLKQLPADDSKITPTMVWEIRDAACAGHAAKLERMLASKPGRVNEKDDDGWTLLHLAVYGNQKDTAKVLLAHNVEREARTSNSFSNVNLAAGSTALHLAASMDHKELVELLLAHGADVNARNDEGRTPLHGAFSPFVTGTVECLLAHKADANVKDKNGRTPLHLAARSGWKDYVELLLAYKAGINARDKHGSTPLHETIMGRNRVLEEAGVESGVFDAHTEVVELLLKNGADINAKDDGGMTPLHLAIVGRNKEQAILLLARGADINARNDLGRTPLDVAKRCQNYKTAAFLRLRGGKSGREIGRPSPTSGSHPK